MNPAALSAILTGNSENFIAAATPGGIERQEAQGQMDESFRDTLPIQGTASDRSPWKTLGFVFGDNADDIFVNVTFPKGWRKKPTDHSMWTQLLDDKGRERAMIFYKAAFYDRSAHVHLSRRFMVADTEYDDDKAKEVRVYVKDANNEVKKEITGLSKPSSYEDRKAASEGLENWLDEHYPDWRSPLAYWES